MIVVNSDFIGRYELALDKFNVDKIDYYIDKYEKKYLIQLLGVDLYNLFIDDLDVNNEPVTSKYITIYEALNYDNNGSIITSDGIKEMLLGFIFYHYTNDNTQLQTPIGTTSAKAENSNVLGANYNNITRFNDCVASFRSIQQYIEDNISDYAAYNGQYLPFEYLL